jgi:hypothetical protein
MFTVDVENQMGQLKRNIFSEKKKKTNRILTNSSNVCKLLQPFNDSRMEPPVWLRAYRRIEKRDEEGFE